MPSLSLAYDTLVFTDQSRVAGGLLNRGTGRTATILSAGMIQELEKTLFGNGKVSARLAAVLDKPAVTYLGNDGSRAIPAKVVLPGLKTTERPPAMGPVSEQSFDSEGTINLDGGSSWRPAGKLRSRNIGKAKLAFIVTNQNLTGKVRPKSMISAARFVASGPTIVANDSSCGICSSCGACALCTACGELNAAAIGAAAAAITNVSHAVAVAFNPKDIAGRRAKARTLSPEAEKVLERLSLICSEM